MFLLAYFDNKIGPKIYYSYPKQMLDMSIQDLICKFVDLDIDNNGYIILVKDTYRIFNFLFSIPSPLARGGVELISFAVVVSNVIDRLQENIVITKCQLLKNALEAIPDIYYAFYPKTEQYENKKIQLQHIIQKLYKTGI